MPITQERMIDLVEASKDYMNAVDMLKREVIRLIESVNRGDMTAANALGTLYTLCDLKGLLGDPTKSYSTIMLESRHFQKFAARNRWERQRQQRRRKEHEQGLEAGSLTPPKAPWPPPKHSTAPKTILANDYDKPSLMSAPDEAMDIDPAALMNVAPIAPVAKSELDKEIDQMLKKVEGK